ncbi:inter-alpha-trypsin inhibitor heavy chain H6 [Microcaecilia unicolor]|uniref:Inter-alpha-trypsin inhibitor heavy chain H6 n=1 Tax=Microcaecilia unicolor TaxID=1415580 RepID=A0A6P7XIA0_9AMPH|nr:inter-alpha-trypsin inhibitor heavy chain H6 [Microcaecilia unicolor]
MTALGRFAPSFLLLLNCVPCLTLRSPQSAVPHNPALQRTKHQSRSPKAELTISSFSIHSTIISRYALTTVESIMKNPHTEAKEAVFDLNLPNSAFISNFTLTTEGKVFVAEVKEKLQAKKLYDEARKHGRTAAHVGTKDRETERFRVLVSVAGGEEIMFTLTYEKLLRRQLGKYEHAVSVRPQQVVHNLTVTVTVSERTGINYIRVLPLRTSRLLTNTLRGEAEIPPGTTIEQGTNCARVTFLPSPEQQASYSPSGIMADFVIQYDTTMKDLAGDLQIYNGYFVHYFAPRNLPVVQKNVVFVIDVSGSMYGTKIQQTKKAMQVILSDLHKHDHFNLITFSDTVNVWKAGRSIPATPQNVKSAKDYVNRIEAEGWTDINAALLAAAAMFNQSSAMQAGSDRSGPRVPLLIFLTDGEPTSGVTSASRILSNARLALRGLVSLFGLAFGDDADYSLMQRLALENRGAARRIYEDADATLQLKGFYDEIASPLLFDVQLIYLGSSLPQATQTLFPNYFAGSELVMAGRVQPGASELGVRLTAQSQREPIKLQNDIPVTGNSTQLPFGCSENAGHIPKFVQRLWAYFTIQDLLQARMKTNDSVTRRLLTEKATNLSLKYNFVTPVTSLVVVQPQREREVQALKTPTPVRVQNATRTTSVSSTAALRITATAASATSTPRLTKAARLSSTVATNSIWMRPGGPKPTTGSVMPWIQGNTAGTTDKKFTKTTSVPVRATPLVNVPSVPQAPLLVTTTRTAHTLSPVAVDPANPPKVQKAAVPMLSTVSAAILQIKLPSEASQQPIPARTALLPGFAITRRGPETEPNGNPTTIYPSFTSLRLLPVPQESELLGSPETDMVLMESLNPLPEYNFLATNIEDFSETEDVADYQIAMLGPQTFMSSVDGDPHFVVMLPHSREKLCFTIDGHPDDNLSLLHDPRAGVTVNGHLMGAPPRMGHEDQTRSYLDVIAVIVQRPGAQYVVTITLDTVSLEGEDRLNFPISHPMLIRKPGLVLNITAASGVTISIGNSIQLLVLIQHYRHPTYLQLDHLGLYVVNGRGFSPTTQGLLGQFQKADIRIVRDRDSDATGVLHRQHRTMPVTHVTRMVKDSLLPPHEAQCWLVRRGDMASLLDMDYSSYLLSHFLQV